MASALARRYRRLLWSYPPGERRHELLDTLLDCAPPGRRWPTVREAANLFRHGMRARLGRAGSRGVVAFAVLTTLACALVGASVAARLSWELAPPLPAGADADALRRTAFPGLRVWGGGDAELFVAQPDGEGVQYGFADYWVEHTAATRDVGAYTAGVRDRLAAAGWRIRSDIVDPDPLEPDADGAVARASAAAFWASRDGLMLAFSDSYRPGRPAYDSDGAAAFHLFRTPPPGLPAEPADTRLSRFTRVFVSQEATADQRNLMEAAIHRVYAAGPTSFGRDPRSDTFRTAYCDHRPLTQAVARTLPWFFNVELSSPGG